MNFLNWTPEDFAENRVSVDQLSDEDVWNRIPLLNVNEIHNFKDSSLVRFRGMVQDMHNPEFYWKSFEVINGKTNEKSIRNGSYCDAIITREDETIDFDSGSNVTSERQSYVVISIPAINSWATDIEEKQFKVEQYKSDVKLSQHKRTHDAMDTLEAGPSNIDMETQKKHCNQNNGNRTEKIATLHSGIEKDHTLHFPLPNENGKTCHVKLYDNLYSVGGKLNLNDMCEFVGFLGINPITEAGYEETEFENQLEKETLHPPSSIAPRIHCIGYKKMRHNNPLLLRDEDKISYDKFSVLRKELLIVLTQLLLGDELAAEYLIIHLLSEIYIKNDMFPLGNCCLNISHVPDVQNLDYASELYKFVEMLLPKSHYLPMTLENINNLKFIPQKNYESNSLTSGILQLSRHTHLVLDETKLCTGKVENSGLQNLKALNGIISDQRINFNFQYYSIEYECDIPILVLSSSKSILRCDLQVVLKPEKSHLDTLPEIINAAKHFLNAELLRDLRKYLTLARIIDYTITDEIAEFLQKEIVKLGQIENISPNSIHLLVVMAKYLTISEGKTTMDEEIWRKACDLESQRKARIVQ